VFRRNVLLLAAMATGLGMVMVWQGVTDSLDAVITGITMLGMRIIEKET